MHFYSNEKNICNDISRANLVVLKTFVIDNTKSIIKELLLLKTEAEFNKLENKFI